MIKPLRLKRAQAAGGAATLVALIAVFIVFYILFLPPAERERLLENKTSTTTQNGGDSSGNIVLLKESPGTLFKEEQTEFEHTISAFNLAVFTQDIVLKQKDSIYVQASGSKEQPQMMILVLKDVDNTKNVKLSFAVGKHSGKLVIKLNGEEVFNGEITTSNPAPINLGNLKEENIIEFSVSSAGWMFWNVNFYELSNIKITATVTNFENQEAAKQFSISYDVEDVKEAKLRFIPECRTTRVGKLTIKLNEEAISSDVPDCGSPSLVDFDPAILRKGGNTLLFSSAAGSYLVDNIIIRTTLREPTYPAYYFLLNESSYGKITNNTRNIFLVIKFAGTEDYWDGTIVINDIKTSFHQRESTFSKNIGSFIREDNNYVRIIPDTTVDVVEIRVELRKV